MKKVLLKIVNTCIWCDQVEMDCPDKFLCSVKCLEEMNKKNPESAFTIKDVCQKKKK